MIDIETQLRSYQHATNVRLEVRQMTGRAADEIKRLRSALNDIARGGHSSLESARHRAEIALNDEQKADPDEGLPTAADVRGILKPNAGQSSK